MSDKPEPPRLRAQFQLLRVGTHNVNDDETVDFRNERRGSWEYNDTERRFDSVEEALAFTQVTEKWHWQDFTIITIYRWLT